MSPQNPRRAVFPGSFDPATHGHMDVIQRGAELFDELIVAVGDNPEKRTFLPAASRVAILRKVASHLPNVRVQRYKGLTVDFARQVGAVVILRGIRNGSDLQRELQIATTNRMVAGIETVFVMTRPEHAFVSSSLIRQVAQMGGDVSSMVPPEVLPHLKKAGRI